jgi:hypothetical protein
MAAEESGSANSQIILSDFPEPFPVFVFFVSFEIDLDQVDAVLAPVVGINDPNTGMGPAASSAENEIPMTLGLKRGARAASGSCDKILK